MGKIRVKTIGDEQQEKEEQRKAKKRAEAKKSLKSAEQTSTLLEPHSTNAGTREEKNEGESSNEKKSSKKYLKSSPLTKQKHSKQYLAIASQVDRNKKYTLSEALALLPKLQRAKFDETVELHINTIEKGISGTIALPHGTGRTIRVIIANQSTDPKQVEELVKAIESGTIDFDVLIATPDTMPKLAKVARILGPKGLMPNPKNGTVTPKPEEMAKKFAGGQTNYKTEGKFPLLHFVVGKVSFGEKKLTDNIIAFIKGVKIKNVKTLTITSTMSPGIPVDIHSLI